MRGISRLPAERGRIESSRRPRLAVCLALLSGCGHAVSEETKREIGSIEPAKHIAEQVEGIGKAVGGGDGVVVAGCDVKGEGKCAEPAPSITEVVRIAGPVDDSAGDIVDEAAAAVANVGECSGKRFRKCR